MNVFFPDPLGSLLFLGPYFAPVILRVAIAVYFLMHAQSMWAIKTQKTKLLAIKEFAFALFFAAGFLTQLFALFGILIVVLRGLWLGKEGPHESWKTKILALGILAALVIAGGGAFALTPPY